MQASWQRVLVGVGFVLGALGLPAVWPGDAAAREPGRETLELVLRETKPRVQDVLLLREGGARNLTRFERPHHVYDVELSPDGELVFVWHMDAPPRRVSVYRLPGGQRLASFAPGYGGALAWTAHGALFHQWGAGTNVTCWALYQPSGAVIARGDCPGVVLSPSHRFLAEVPYPMVGCGLVVRDLRDGRVIYERPVAELCDPETWPELEWEGVAQLRVDAVRDGKPTTLRLGFGE